MADANTRAGVSVQDAAVKAFVDQLHHGESVAMTAAVEAGKAAKMPAIQVGPSDGAALALLFKAIGARRVVEVGTLAGYSALWILGALPKYGHLWTFEFSSSHAAVAAGIFADAGESDRVTLIQGKAIEGLAAIEADGPFDAVFIDADKVSYPAYGEWALANVRSGGLVVADNSYLFGYLAGREPDVRAPADHIEAMQGFHRLLAERCPVRACLPTNDGLLVGMIP